MATHSSHTNLPPTTENLGLLFLEDSAEIYLRSFKRAEYDKVTVTTRCSNIQEFENEINRLQEELERLRQIADRKFGELHDLKKSA
jgi:hypothetical protein